MQRVFVDDWFFEFIYQLRCLQLARALSSTVYEKSFRLLQQEPGYLIYHPYTQGIINDLDSETYRKVLSFLSSVCTTIPSHRIFEFSKSFDSLPRTFVKFSKSFDGLPWIFVRVIAFPGEPRNDLFHDSWGTWSFWRLELCVHGRK